MDEHYYCSGCETCQDARQIKKGDKFVCIRDVVMDSGKTAYLNGEVYRSDNDGCITNKWRETEHSWTFDNPDDDKWQDYFKRYEDCGKVRPDRDYFQAMQEEYGKRTFESGAVRDSNEGKSRPDLISPYFTERLGFRLAEGANKYEERNWEKGIPDAAFLESLERHLVAYKMGKTDEDHAAAIAFNIMGIIHNEEVRKK